MTIMTEDRDLPPTTPGQFLRERVLRGGPKITQDTLATALGVSRFTVNQILNGHRSVTADMAVRLAHVLGTSAEMWVDMQSRLDLFHARRRAADTLAQLPRLRDPVDSPPA